MCRMPSNLVGPCLVGDGSTRKFSPSDNLTFKHLESVRLPILKGSFTSAATSMARPPPPPSDNKPVSGGALAAKCWWWFVLTQCHGVKKFMGRIVPRINVRVEESPDEWGDYKTPRHCSNIMYVCTCNKARSISTGKWFHDNYICGVFAVVGKVTVIKLLRYVTCYFLK